VVSAWQDYERGRAPRAVAEELEEASLREYVNLQNRFSCRPVVYPMNRWPDMLRGFTEITAGLVAGPLTRFLETNTFYRAPVRTLAPSLREDLLEGWLATYLPCPDTSSAVKYVLPSPYYFGAVTQSQEPLAMRVSEMGEVIGAVIGALKRRHQDSRKISIQLQEPYIGAFGVTDAEALSVLEAFLRSISRKYDLPVVVHTYFGGTRETLEGLLRLPVAAVGIDACAFSPESIASVTWNPDVNLYLGLQDVRTTRRFDDDLLKSYIDGVIASWNPPEMTLSFNGDPEFLPPDVFAGKLEQMTRLRERYV
jgi:5-methyltetrahydropteroyltriglutamate--homocysteine methyltransferase